MKQKKQIKCYECKTKVSWANCNCVFGDDKYNTIKGMIYCFKCFYNKTRKKDIKKNSIDLIKLLNK